MRDKLHIFMVLGLLLVLTACGSKASNEADTGGVSDAGEKVEEITLKLGHVSATGDTHMDVASNLFKEEVEKASNGQIKVQIYPSAQLGGERDMMESVATGTVEMSLMTTLTFDSQTPAFNGLSFPFLFENNEQFNKILHGETMKKAFASLDDLNLHALGVISGGIRHFGTTEKPVLSLDDMKGLKMRAAENQMITDSYKELGTVPVTVPYADMFSAVQTGVVDGLSFDLHTWYSEGFYELIDHISLVNDMPIAAVLVMNLNLYNSLSDEQRKIINEASEKMESYMVEKLQEFESTAIDKLKELNIEIHNNVDTTLFKGKMEPIYKKYGEKHPLIQGVIDEVNALK